MANTFIFYIDHQALKYFVNKPIRHSQIFLGILLFQEFEFEIILQPGKPNVSPDHLSIIETSEEPDMINNDLPITHLFQIEFVLAKLEDIVQYLQEGRAPEGMS